MQALSENSQHAIIGEDSECTQPCQSWVYIEDPTLELDFDVETFRFSICRQGREPHDLNAASEGLSALLDIIFNLLLRMVRKNGHSTEFDLPGIVLIDEVEAHLHLSLQRRVLPILTGLFPNVQFVVTTHSPFVLSSIENATLIDLEARVLVRGGLVGSTYESIVEGSFNVDALSEDLMRKLDRYRELSAKDALSDEEFLEARKLELSLDEAPDFLALSIATEYQKAKLELHNNAVG